MFLAETDWLPKDVVADLNARCFKSFDYVDLDGKNWSQTKNKPKSFNCVAVSMRALTTYMTNALVPHWIFGAWTQRILGPPLTVYQILMVIFTQNPIYPVALQVCAFWCLPMMGHLILGRLWHYGLQLQKKKLQEAEYINLVDHALVPLAICQVVYAILSCGWLVTVLAIVGIFASGL